MNQRAVHTFIAWLEDEPGVLNRVTSLFRRRNYNILSLNVGRTHEKGISRLTCVIEADDDMARRIEANLRKLVNVIEVQDITYAPALVRELGLLKVSAPPERRAEILQLAEVFRARAVDVTEDGVVLEMTGTADKLDGLVAVLRPFGILEMGRSGLIAMTRGQTRQDA
jgi:acetolactate synthase I/III small subunit